MNQPATRRAKIKNHLATHRRLYATAAVFVGVVVVASRIPVPQADVSGLVDLRIHQDWLASMQETGNCIVFDIEGLGEYALSYLPESTV